MMFTRSIALIAAGLCIPVNSLFAQSSSYDVVRLNPPGAYAVQTWPLFLNEAGVVIGRYSTLEEPGSGEFLYNSASGEYWINDYGFSIEGLSDRTELIGNFEDFETEIFWGMYVNAPGAVPEPLPPLTSGASSWAEAINNVGLIAGYSFDPASPSSSVGEAVPVLWQVTDDRISEPFPLPAPIGEGIVSAEQVGPPNRNGLFLVVGRVWVYDDDMTFLAAPLVSWTVQLQVNGTLEVQDGPTPMEALGGDLIPEVSDINTNLFSVGNSAGQAFKKSHFGDLKSLKPLKWIDGNSIREIARSVNDAKDVVGTAVLYTNGNINDDGEYRAVMWPGGARPVDLNNYVTLDRPEAFLPAASAVNNQGQILARYMTKPRRGRSFAALLVPQD